MKISNVDNFRKTLFSNLEDVYRTNHISVIDDVMTIERLNRKITITVEYDGSVNLYYKKSQSDSHSYRMLSDDFKNQTSYQMGVASNIMFLLDK